MKTYSLDERLPDLPTSPREPDYECYQCGALFDLPSRRMRDPDGADDFCPECGSNNFHRA